MEENWIPIEALFDDGVGPNLEADPRSALASADVIVGRDVMTKNEFLVYGREYLTRVMTSKGTVPTRMLRIELDQETEELEKLLALVTVVKGKHDYE